MANRLYIPCSITYMDNEQATGEIYELHENRKSKPYITDDAALSLPHIL